MAVQLIQGDCLEEMDKLIEAGVKVDAIIGDLPYGTTACSWDEIIPFAPMWERVKKINKVDASGMYDPIESTTKKDGE